jgi:hypothetical protein
MTHAFLFSLLLGIILPFQSFQPERSVLSQSVAPASDTLYWKTDVKLNWADFQSTAPGGHNFAAYTFTIITMEYEVLERGTQIHPRFTVRSAFQRSKSWVDRKDPLAQTPEILAHEQLHFNISEITARDLRKKLRSKKYTSNYRKEIRGIYEQAIQHGDDMQKRYDKETRHGLSKEAQQRWSSFVAEQLNNQES